MKNLLLTALLLAGLAAPIARAAETVATPAESNTPATTNEPADITAAPEAAEPDHKGLSISIDVGDKDKDADVEKTKKELRQKILTFVDGVLKDADVELSDEDKADLRKELKHELKVEHGGKEGSDFGITDLAGLAVAALAVVFIFGTPIMIVAFILYASYRKRRLIHDTINSYVATGKEIPPEVFKSFHEEASPKNNLQKGLLMMGIGAGIIICFLVIGVDEAAALGAIPLFIGLAQLLIWKLEKNGSGSKGGN